MSEFNRPPFKNVPVLPLRNTLLFPQQAIPVVVGRSKSLAAVELALKQDRWIVVVAQRADVADPKIEDLYRVGVLARIENRIGGDGGRGQQLILSGQQRFQLGDIRDENGLYVTDGAPLEDIMDLQGDMADSLMQNMKSLSREIFSFLPTYLAQLSSLVDNISDPSQLTYLVVQNIDLPVARKQEFLEMLSLKNRFLAILEVLIKARDELKIQKEVEQKVSSKLGKQQREALLREQIRTLQDELGEGRGGLAKEYLSKIEDAKMSEEAKKLALEQVGRLESMPSASPELHVIRNHLDLLVSLPWQETSMTEIDLERAKSILEKDHFGLEKIKKRILQHLAVMKLRQDKKGSILLFVGPPGVGKTSLAKSIAEALDRPYVRISLGGVRDDAEVRGHRRTYVGAMPGRIIDGLKRAGKNNPVFVLDEIDKLARGYGGDPASAMLEVLDPEQNANFLDHYLDVPFDLSRVFFVGTANTLESIPAPLLDRMEVIQCSGYTQNEKFNIGKRHLVPKQLHEHGIKNGEVDITDSALGLLISGHTREAGVRDLQRQIAALARYAAERIVREPAGQRPVRIGLTEVEEALGPVRFESEQASRRALPGVVTGLAWTPMGGDILFVESQMMPGKGELVLTGQLGDVMKESARIAFTHVRSRVEPLNPKLNLASVDVHLHVPAGAIPKDGPSAGVTMLTSLASLLTGRLVPTDLAMTGEITLRGAVTPVGGIKEKLIAAHRAGVRRVILASRNKRDLRDVPEDIKGELQIIFVENIDEILFHALGLKCPSLPAGPFDSPSNFA